MVDVSAYAPSLSAVGAARTSTASAVKVATSYGERPSFRDDFVTAGAATRAMSSKVSRLNDVRALERIDGVLGVTLAATDAIVDALTELKTLASRLQDQSLTDDMRATLTNEYNKLLPRIDELTEMATFGGRNLINPTAANISGDLELPDGQIVEARDLRAGRGVQIGNVPAREALIVAWDEAPTSPELGAFQTVGVSDASGQQFADGTVGLKGGGNGPLMIANAAGSIDNFTLSVRLQADDFSNKGIFQLNGNGEYFRSIISGYIDSSNRLILHQYRGIDEDGQYFGGAAGTLIGPSIEDGRDFEWTVKIDKSGQLHGYVDGVRYGSSSGPHYQVFGAGSGFGIQLGISGSEFTTAPVSHFDGMIGHIAIYDEALSDLEVIGHYVGAKAGIEHWQADGDIDWANARIDRWAATSQLLDASIRGVLDTQAQFGGAARSAELKSQIQQRMADAIDAATERLVNRDIDRLGSLRAAGEVREQLSQAMMQAQTTTLFAQTSLFSNALALFDAINIGGFRPKGLETAGTRTSALDFGTERQPALART